MKESNNEPTPFYQTTKSKTMLHRITSTRSTGTSLRRPFHPGYTDLRWQFNTTATNLPLNKCSYIQHKDLVVQHLLFDMHLLAGFCQ
jgi:hypothetical protein